MGRFRDEILSRLNTIVRERKALGGPSQRRLALLVGCSSAHMTHLLTGRSPLTLDWLERICAALRIDPARLLEVRDGPLACSAYDIYDKPEAAAHERIQELLERGFHNEMATWIDLTEKLLKLCQGHFSQLVANTGAQEGVLWRRRGSGLQAVCSSLAPDRLQSLKAGSSRKGWKEFSLGEFELWLKDPLKRDAESQSELFLAMLSDLFHCSRSPGKEKRLF